MKKIKLPIETIIEEYQNGESTITLGRKYNISPNTIYRRLKENNIKIRSYSEAQILAEHSGRFTSEIREKQRQAVINYHKNNPQNGPLNSNWKGGKFKDSKGYVMILIPEHPFAVSGYVREHRLIMENKLGRYLEPEEFVHHKNQIRDDNDPENLILVEQTNHYGEIKCPYCKEHFLIK